MTVPLITREMVYINLFGLTANAAWAGQTFLTRARKWKDYSQLGQGEFPALFQIEPTEDIDQLTGMRPKRWFDAKWIVYIKTDPQDPSDVGASLLNNIIDSLEGLFLVDNGVDNLQTLGGLVHHAYISGSVIKVAGDDTGEGLAVIPIKVLVE